MKLLTFEKRKGAGNVSKTLEEVIDMNYKKSLLKFRPVHKEKKANHD
ncbi:hypothetical protein [Aquibacillus sediminis]|nr:hypothetical protein [Aquibacillus sediminis]